MNDYLIISKRATQIIQDNNQAINYLNINAAINQAAREFKEKEKKECEKEIFISSCDK